MSLDGATPVSVQYGLVSQRSPPTFPPRLQVHRSECEMYPISCESCGQHNIARKLVSEESSREYCIVRKLI